MTQEFPRLLVATEFPPNASGGGGAIVRQMLKGWPVEKLFWWSCTPDSNKRFGQQVAAHRVAKIPRRLYPLRRLVRQKAWLMDNLWVPYATRHFRQTLAELQPEVVWIIPHAWAIPPLARVLPESGIGYHASMHDYPDVKILVDGLGSRRCRQWLKAIEQLYGRATTRDAICQPMVDDLCARTGAIGTVARAGLEQDDFTRLSTKTTTPADRIRIAYAGTILMEKEFALFVEALDNIRARLTRPVSLEFFGDHCYRARAWFDPTWMTEHGNLSAPALLEALKKCAWGFAPMGLTDDNPRYNRYSLPTKFVSYLQAGLPVISLGHPESSVTKLMAAYRVGLTYTPNDQENLSQKLLAELSVLNPWLKFGPEILRCARDGFNLPAMRKTLMENFQLCTSTSLSVGCGNDHQP